MKSPSDPVPTGLLNAFRSIVVGGRFYVAVALGKPSPSHRPRVARNGGVFYPKGYVEWQKACQVGFAESRTAHGWPAFTAGDNLLALMDVRIASPKSTIRHRPGGDFDNYAKAPLDAATKVGLWADDDMVTVGAIQKRWVAPEHQGTVLLVGVLETAWQERLSITDIGQDHLGLGRFGGHENA